MAKAIKCPQCGGADPKKISETEFECIYCSTSLYVDPPPKKEVNNQQRKNNSAEQMNMAYTHARKTGRTMTLIIISVLIVVLGFAFYMAQKSMNDYKNTMDDVKKQFEQEIRKI